jgi:hypothetical protein
MAMELVEALLAGCGWPGEKTEADRLAMTAMGKPQTNVGAL